MSGLCKEGNFPARTVENSPARLLLAASVGLAAAAPPQR